MSTRNFYLNEMRPTGTFWMWVDGNDDVREAQDAEVLNGSLCKNLDKFNYVYQADSWWDYRYFRCIAPSLRTMYVPESAGRAVFFATAEQVLRSVIYPNDNATAGSCDATCRHVYPQWPSAADYVDNKSWMTVHAVTDEFEGRVLNGPNQVYMRKPFPTHGNRCSCQSYQNFLTVGIGKSIVMAPFSYVSRNAPYGSALKASSDDPLTIVIRDGGSVPCKIFEKGRAFNMTLDDILACVGSCLDCLPDLDITSHLDNVLCEGGICPDGIKLQPYLRTSGALVDLRTEVYTHERTMPTGGAYDYIRERFKPPYAIHILRITYDWGTQAITITNGNTDQSVTETTNFRYGIFVRLDGVYGATSQFDIRIIGQTLVNGLVLLGVPSLLLSFVMFAFLGRRSTLFRRMTRKVLTIDDMYQSFTINSMRTDMTFRHLDPENKGYISKHTFLIELQRLLLPGLQQQCPDRPVDDLQKLITSYGEGMLEELTREDLGTEAIHGISQAAFVRASLHTEPFSWEVLVSKVLDPDVDADPADKACKCCRRRKDLEVNTSGSGSPTGMERTSSCELVPERHEIRRTLNEIGIDLDIEPPGENHHNHSQHLEARVEELERAIKSMGAAFNHQRNLVHTEMTKLATQLNMITKGKSSKRDDIDVTGCVVQLETTALDDAAAVPDFVEKVSHAEALIGLMNESLAAVQTSLNNLKMQQQSLTDVSDSLPTARTEWNVEDCKVVVEQADHIQADQFKLSHSMAASLRSMAGSGSSHCRSPSNSPFQTGNKRQI